MNYYDDDDNDNDDDNDDVCMYTCTFDDEDSNLPVLSTIIIDWIGWTLE